MPQVTINRGSASITFGAFNLSASQIAAIFAVLDGADESKVPAAPVTERPELRQNPEAFGKFAQLGSWS